MLNTEIKQTLSEYFANIKQPVSLVLQTGQHSKRDELAAMLQEISSLSDLIDFTERDTDGALRSPISFTLERAGEPTGVVFSGIPGGHEFNSLVLGILHAGGHEMKLDASVQEIVKRVTRPMHFEVFISLSCHNCPDVVQALNQFALLNDNIKSEMIDGGLFRDVIESRDIQGVPTVYLNGELFGSGKVDAAQLLDKLIEIEPEITKTSSESEVASILPLQDVTVIGGGPAGVAAAIYSARKGLKVTLIAEVFGGQVKDTMGIENLISVPKTTGPEVVVGLQDHLGDYDITMRESLRVTDVSPGHIKAITLSSGEVINSRTLIVATGARWKELGVPGERENIGNGVAYCPHCDGPFFKGRDVAVIGGGNSGVEAALDLAGIVKSVTVYEFQSTLQADQVLVDQVHARDNIKVKTNVATTAINAENGKVSSLDFEDRATGELHKDEQAGVFVQIGLLPNSQVVSDLVETKPWGEIVINEKCETSVPGIYACGDVTTVPYKQIVVAMGEGSKAALAAFEYLLTHEVETTEMEKVA